jgi:hypothetical protein
MRLDQKRVSPHLSPLVEPLFHGLLAMIDDHLILLSAWTVLYLAVWLLALQRLTP